MSTQNIYSKLKAAIGNDFGVCGLMGNLKAESNMRANNLQNTYSKKFGMSDEQYTEAVDNGSYTNFVRDSAGYGLAQWTYWSRKEKLLKYAQAYGTSIGDEDMQIEFMLGELVASYPTVLNALKNAKSVREASDIVLTQYERPADQSESVQVKRASYGEEFYKQFVTTTEGKEETDMGYTNSPLVTYKRITNNKTANRKYGITRITPHCIVGQWTAKQGCDYFATTDRECSANYIVGKDGSVGLSVEEKDRSWCSSSSDNDHRAVTIECASDTSSPYAFTDVCYNKLIDLCVDICKRYGKTKLLWFGDKTKTLNYKPASNEMVITVHRWFANKSCPGDWLYSRLGDLAAKVTARLGGATTTPTEESKTETNMSFPACPFTVQVFVNDLNYRSTGSMNGTVKGQTGKGTFTIVEVKDGWGKLKSGVGWIYLENTSYVKIGKTVTGATTTKKEETFKPYAVRVKIKDLNIRKGPGTNYGKNGFCPVGVYTIIAESDGAGASKWGKLKSGVGWISLDYVTKI